MELPEIYALDCKLNDTAGKWFTDGEKFYEVFSRGDAVRVIKTAGPDWLKLNDELLKAVLVAMKVKRKLNYDEKTYAAEVAALQAVIDRAGK